MSTIDGVVGMTTQVSIKATTTAQEPPAELTKEELEALEAAQKAEEERLEALEKARKEAMEAAEKTAKEAREAEEKLVAEMAEEKVDLKKQAELQEKLAIRQQELQAANEAVAFSEANLEDFWEEKNGPTVVLSSSASQEQVSGATPTSVVLANLSSNSKNSDQPAAEKLATEAIVPDPARIAAEENAARIAAEAARSFASMRAVMETLGSVATSKLDVKLGSDPRAPEMATSTPVAGASVGAVGASAGNEAGGGKAAAPGQLKKAA